METTKTRIVLRAWTLLVVLFLWIPLVLISIYAFNKSVVQSWPIPGWTTHWFSVTWHNADARSALWLSVKVGLLATGVALALGSMAAFAIDRFRFFGRESISFLLLLTITPVTIAQRLTRDTGVIRSTAQAGASAQSTQATTV